MAASMEIIYAFFFSPTGILKNKLVAMATNRLKTWQI
jgi:hypothetical protein